MTEGHEADAIADLIIIQASTAYCAAAKRLQRLCRADHDISPPLADRILHQMRMAERLAIGTPATSMTGVIAKARMVVTGECREGEPLTMSVIQDLLTVQKRLAPEIYASGSTFGREGGQKMSRVRAQRASRDKEARLQARPRHRAKKRGSPDPPGAPPEEKAQRPVRREATSRGCPADDENPTDNDKK